MDLRHAARVLRRRSADPQKEVSAMDAVLVTGGSGFFGDVLKARLLAEGFRCVNVDLQRDVSSHPALVSIQGDIRNVALLDRLFAEHRFGAVFHCAAMLAHDTLSRDVLWSHNVDGTKVVARLAAHYGVPKVVYISSNCRWVTP